MTKSELCRQCQACCKELGVHTRYLYEPNIVEFFKARGFTVLQDDDNFAYLTWEHVCPHLTPDGCDIYMNRPQVCEDFDGRLEMIGWDNSKCKWKELKDE